jgi:hypothetical protein
VIIKVYPLNRRAPRLSGFILLCISLWLIPFSLACQDFDLKEDLGGWGDLAWGDSLEQVQGIYHFSGETQIISTNTWEITMSNSQDLQISGKFLNEESIIYFHFDNQGKLKSVEAEFVEPSIPQLEEIQQLFSGLYGSFGSKAIISRVSNQRVGSSLIWIRPQGQLRMDHSQSYCKIKWEKPWDESFPTVIFQGVDSADEEEVIFLINGGFNLQSSFPIFEDESGEIAQAGILDYVFLFSLQDPENRVYPNIIKELIKYGAPLYFFPEEILQGY